MAATEEYVRDALNSLRTLNIELPAHYAVYDAILRQFITINEGVRQRVYCDHQNAQTIGIGFNMSAHTAEHEWRRVFGISLSFTDVLSGKRSMSDDQISQLFSHTINLRRKELQLEYAGYWRKLKPNEMVAIEDAYYNGPRLVNRNTRFASHIKAYINTSNVEYLDAAADELRYHSNPTGHKGVQSRRNAQSNMLVGII